MRSAGRAALALVLVGAAGAGGVVGVRWLADEARGPRCELSIEGASEQLTPEQAANAATIAMVAVDRGLPPRAATIALTTAIQESKLRNLTYGDADSLGLFQQRTSQGWGTREEILDPVASAHRFYAALEQVPGWQEQVITEAAQEVQRSAYPGAYADHEDQGRVLASVLTGQVPATVVCRLDDPGSGDAAALLTKAQQQFSGTGTVTGQVLSLEAPDRVTAWAIASWAVAHAEADDVLQVQVDGQAWHRDQDPQRWSATDETTGGTTVTVVVAP